MKQEIMQRWVKALRSGKYQQGTERLREKTATGRASRRFCCLGVLCDLYAQEHKGAGWQAKPTVELAPPAGRVAFKAPRANAAHIIESNTIVPPSAVCAWAGLKIDTGRFTPNRALRKELGLNDLDDVDLVELNDDGALNFDKLADVIEKHWRKL
jgi:hypothetical protein